MKRSASNHKSNASEGEGITPAAGQMNVLEASSTALEKRANKEARKIVKAAAKAEKKGEHGLITPGKTKKVIGVAKIVLPLLAPYALRAASALREAGDRMRARKLGVPVDDLGSYTGKGAKLHARIAGDAEALRELRERQAGRTDSASVAVEQFTEAAEARLIQLTSAVRAAERMPASRRRAAHHAVNGELSRIENDLLNRLGV